MSPWWTFRAGRSSCHVAEGLRPFSGVSSSGIGTVVQYCPVKASVWHQQLWLGYSALWFRVVLSSHLVLPAVGNSTDFQFPAHPSPSLFFLWHFCPVIEFAWELEKMKGPLSNPGIMLPLLISDHSALYAQIPAPSSRDPQGFQQWPVTHQTCPCWGWSEDIQLSWDRIHHGHSLPEPTGKRLPLRVSCCISF